MSEKVIVKNKTKMISNQSKQHKNTRKRIALLFVTTLCSFGFITILYGGEYSMKIHSGIVNYSVSNELHNNTPRISEKKNVVEAFIEDIQSESGKMTTSRLLLLGH